MKDANIEFGKREYWKIENTKDRESRVDVFIDGIPIGYLSSDVYHEDGRQRFGDYLLFMGADAEIFRDLGIHSNLVQTRVALKEIILEPSHESHGDIWRNIVSNWKTMANNARGVVYSLTDRSNRGDVHASAQLPHEENRLNALNDILKKYNSVQQER